MPRRKRYSSGHSQTRIRTSSQSSVEIQVGEHAVITTTTTTITPGVYYQCSGNDSLLVPKAQFLELLRGVGAQGTPTQCGEVFTLKRLGYYLKEYIKGHELYDVFNPIMVHCGKDPLGAVFGVSQFSLKEVKDLLLKSTVRLETMSPQKGHRNQSQLVLSKETYDETHKNQQGNRHSAAHSSPPVESSALNATQVLQCNPHSHEVRKAKRKKRKCNKRSGSGSGESRQERKPSISIIIDSDCEDSSASYPYIVQWQLDDNVVQWHFDDSDSDSIYSIQSKTTAIVSDSSDDYWFLEEDVTVEMSETGFSVEFQSSHSDPPYFEEEYEVPSDASDSTIPGMEEDEATSEEESDGTRDHHESDMQFWADSESSDCETDSSDTEISDTDKWDCQECKWKNRPVNRHCDRCWSLREGWLPDAARQTPEKDRVSAYNLLSSFNTTFKRGREDDFYSSSDNEAASCYYQSKKMRTNQDIDIPCTEMMSNSRNCGGAGEGSLLLSITFHESVSGDRATASVATVSTAKLGSSTTATQVLRGPISTPTPVSHSNNSVTPDTHLTPPHTELLPNTSLANDTVLMEEWPLSQSKESQDSGLHDCSPMHNVSFDSQDISDNEIIPPSPGASGKKYIFDEKYIENRITVSSECKSTGSSSEHCTTAAGEHLPAAEHIQVPYLDNKSRGVCPTISHFKNVPFTASFAEAGCSSAMSQNKLSTDAQGCRTIRHHLDNSKKQQQVRQADETKDYSTLCSICLSEPKDASMIHGHTGHQVCCYKCAKRLYRRGKPCPVCRRRIHKVIRNYFV